MAGSQREHKQQQKTRLSPQRKFLLVVALLLGVLCVQFPDEFNQLVEDPLGAVGEWQVRAGWAENKTERAAEFFRNSGKHRNNAHTNNWALIVCSSRFWFNYRHVSNALGFYHSVKRLGVPDSQIILMLADDMACNPRNSYAATVFNNKNKQINLYDSDIEVDYRGYDVNVENVIRLLTGRHPPDTPRSKRLLTDENSNVLVYLSGHGGDEFLKFQDEEEISSNDLADAFAQMHTKRRYNELLFIIDTCQANTLFNQFYSPNIVSIGSSRKGENSYSYESDPDVGVAVIDRFTYFTLNYFERHHAAIGAGNTTMKQLFSMYNPQQIASHVGWNEALMERKIGSVPVLDFFGSVGNTIPTAAAYPRREQTAK